MLGHDLRWRTVTALAKSDRRVNELVDEFGEPQNLVSYHLGLLKRSGLVSERRSSADARDVYYHLELDQLGSGLGAAAAAVHPGLLATPDRPAASTRVVHPARVLFICSGNSARSQIAEALLRSLGSDRVEVHSAGPNPAAVHPLALEVLSELGVPATGLRSKGMDEVAGIDFDYVITLCDIARELCPPLSGKPRHMHWSLPDPAAVSGPAIRRRSAFRATRKELIERIGYLVQLLEAGGN